MTNQGTNDPRIRAFWASYQVNLPEEKAAPLDPPPAWHFVDEPEPADRLGALVLDGVKTATASLFWSYAAEGEALPKAGDLSIITNWAGEPLCLIRTSEVRILPFQEVEVAFAFDEGEGDRSLENWRRVHWEYFSKECTVIGREPAADMPVVCERFEVIYKGGAPMQPQETHAAIQAVETELEQVLHDYEQAEDLENALKHYWILEERLLDLGIPPEGALFQAQQRVLAAIFMRQANILRQFGRGEKAAEVSICELEAARNSGDDLTLARSLISYGATLIFSGDIEPGLEYMEEARRAFSRNDSIDYRQGLGWYWILRADLANAKVINGGAQEALEAASQAIALLEPIDNWPGVARAWAARAIACEVLGDQSGVESARQAQAVAQSRIANG